MHYCVTVITKDGNYEKALEPFGAYLEEEPYILETAKEMVEKKRKDLDFAISSNQKNYQKFLETTFDYSSDEALLKSVMDYEKPNKQMWYDKNGNRLATYNKNEKWDWYILGGRYEDGLILKDGSRANMAQIKDIDFEAYKLTPEEEKRQTKFWQVVVEKKDIQEDEETNSFETVFKPEYYLEEYGDLENYLKQMGSFTSYAMLYNGEWLEGDGETNDIREYQKRFEQILQEVEPNYYLALVDCHD